MIFKIISYSLLQMSTTLNLSDKFAKDLNKFFIWVKENNYVVKKDDEVVNWSQDMLPDFTEPSRNKIDAYVKELFQFYKLYDKTNLPIEETYIKIIIKEFKENKPSLKKSKKVETNEIVDDIQNTNREPKESIVKRKYTKRSVKNTEENIVKAQTDSGMSCSESECEHTEEFEIKINENNIKLVHKHWDVSVDKDKYLSFIEYIVNNKDKIVANLKTQIEQSENPKQKKGKTVKKQKESENIKEKKEKVTKKQKVVENVINESEKVIENVVEENVVEEKVALKVVTNWGDSTIEPGSPDLADEFGQVSLDDIEF
jgi:hypothetical protein